MSWQAGKGQKQAGDLFWLIPPGLKTCFLQTKQYFSFIKKIIIKKKRDDRLKLPTFLSVSKDINSFSLQWFLIEYPFEVMIAII